MQTIVIHTPSEQEIEQTITNLYERLELTGIDLLKNKAVKEGYTEAVDILADDKRSYSEISPLLTSDQSRAIAVLAVDYLNGECSEKVLLGVPIKVPIERKLKR